VPAIEVLYDQCNDKNLRQALAGVVKGLGSGKYLSKSLQGYPRIFNAGYIAMIRIGETTGRLQESIERLADWTEADFKTTQKVRSALVYPAFIVVMALALTAVFFYWVMPSLLGIFEGFKMELPWITRALMWVTKQARNIWTWLGLFALIYEVRRQIGKQLTTESGRLFWYRISTKIPVLGRVLVATSLFRFSGALANLVEVGVPLVTAWTFAAEVSECPELQQDSKRVKQKMVEGQDLHEVLDPSIYPSQFRQMLNVGAESSRLGDMLMFVGQLYSVEVERGLDLLAAMLEPLFLSVMALGVVTIILAIILPLYGLLNHM
jgi:type II secretory pathway component PulF